MGLGFVEHEGIGKGDSVGSQAAVRVLQCGGGTTCLLYSTVLQPGKVCLKGIGKTTRDGLQVRIFGLKAVL